VLGHRHGHGAQLEPRGLQHGHGGERLDPYLAGEAHGQALCLSVSAHALLFRQISSDVSSIQDGMPGSTLKSSAPPDRRSSVRVFAAITQYRRCGVPSSAQLSIL